MIQLENVSKQFGELKAVDSLNLHVREGEIFGFIGPNGAGKTTTLRMLATLLRPTSGKIRIAGLDPEIEPGEVRRIIGYMPDQFGVYPDLVVWEYLDFFGAAYEIPSQQRARLIDDVLDLTDLGGKKFDLVEALSRGMKQRLCLAKTLLHDPSLLLLDEPASGLDPRARIEIRELLKELKKMNKTILISSHILAELSDFCTSIGIIERGQLVIAGSISDIETKMNQTRLYRITALEPSQRVEAFLKQMGIDPVASNANYIEFACNRTDEEVASILQALVREELRITSFQPVQANLEDLFMKITRGEVA
jgi:ABC-2 type transport system ATP-binding protein